LTPRVGVAVVSICGPDHLRRCLAALADQHGAPPFDVVVAYDPELAGLDRVAAECPGVRFVANVGQRTPLELASRAIRESRGDVVALTEDHCIPHRDWVARLVSDLTDGRAAAGGVVELAEGATAVDWAFYFVDFFRYADPVADGPSPTLTVCNVAYRRANLEALDDRSWTTFFHETAVNDALRARFGVLHLGSAPRVAMRRHVTLRDAIHERYAFGRLFGCTRLRHIDGPARRAMYRAGAPLLPVVLLGRMVRKALRSAPLRRRLASGWVPLVLMVLAGSWGEWLGYLTGRYPGRLTVAPEVSGGPGSP
jgi:hypothetical protein